MKLKDKTQSSVDLSRRRNTKRLASKKSNSFIAKQARSSSYLQSKLNSETSTPVLMWTDIN